MKITIGEIINEVMPYARNIEMNMAGSFPFLKVDLGDNSNYTKGHLYIVQVKEHQYSMCDYYDDLHGNRYVPTQKLNRPFIKEIDLIRSKFEAPNDSDKNDTTILNVGYSSFFGNFWNILFRYKVIKPNPRSFGRSILDSTILPLFPRIQKSLELIFKEQDIKNPSIADFVSIIKVEGKLNLKGIKPKDIIELESKFKDIGINLEIQNNIITNLQFEKV